jgi:hypothetical protein
VKLMCKCGNIEEIKTDRQVANFIIRNCDDGTAAIVCKKCNEVVFVGFMNK